ncbi:hypothetical protein BESB_012060 [Besnoitia besnoiti]|uniref:UBA domain-containing protein n=1 Tax=Besnoitia besnoiti TaxID=94643 RepID=A0A2A9M5X3_BESBE|nr:hypothetical protein BESB_012060 [Besnoitia besnoiti]PFH32594.1 hypothetical protein BESB_012060 [Besnoitia besnoiti]
MVPASCPLCGGRGTYRLGPRVKLREHLLAQHGLGPPQSPAPSAAAPLSGSLPPSASPSLASRLFCGPAPACAASAHPPALRAPEGAEDSQLAWLRKHLLCGLEEQERQTYRCPFCFPAPRTTSETEPAGNAGGETGRSSGAAAAQATEGGEETNGDAAVFVPVDAARAKAVQDRLNARLAQRGALVVEELTPDEVTAQFVKKETPSGPSSAQSRRRPAGGAHFSLSAQPARAYELAPHAACGGRGASLPSPSPPAGSFSASIVPAPRVDLSGLSLANQQVIAQLVRMGYPFERAVSAIRQANLSPVLHVCVEKAEELEANDLSKLLLDLGSVEAREEIDAARALRSQKAQENLQIGVEPLWEEFPDFMKRFVAASPLFTARLTSQVRVRVLLHELLRLRASALKAYPCVAPVYLQTRDRRLARLLLCLARQRAPTANTHHRRILLQCCRRALEGGDRVGDEWRRAHEERRESRGNAHAAGAEAGSSSTDASPPFHPLPASLFPVFPPCGRANTLASLASSPFPSSSPSRSSPSSSQSADGFRREPLTRRRPRTRASVNPEGGPSGVSSQSEAAASSIAPASQEKPTGRGQRRVTRGLGEDYDRPTTPIEDAPPSRTRKARSTAANQGGSPLPDADAAASRCAGGVRTPSRSPAGGGIEGGDDCCADAACFGVQDSLPPLQRGAQERTADRGVRLSQKRFVEGGASQEGSPPVHAPEAGASQPRPSESENEPQRRCRDASEGSRRDARGGGAGAGCSVESSGKETETPQATGAQDAKRRGRSARRSPEGGEAREEGEEARGMDDRAKEEERQREKDLLALLEERWKATSDDEDAKKGELLEAFILDQKEDLQETLFFSNIGSVGAPPRFLSAHSRFSLIVAFFSSFSSLLSAFLSSPEACLPAAGGENVAAANALAEARRRDLLGETVSSARAAPSSLLRQVYVRLHPLLWPPTLVFRVTEDAALGRQTAVALAALFCPASRLTQLPESFICFTATPPSSERGEAADSDGQEGERDAGDNIASRVCEEEKQKLVPSACAGDMGFEQVAATQPAEGDAEESSGGRGGAGDASAADPRENTEKKASEAETAQDEDADDDCMILGEVPAGANCASFASPCPGLSASSSLSLPAPASRFPSASASPPARGPTASDDGGAGIEEEPGGSDSDEDLRRAIAASIVSYNQEQAAKRCRNALITDFFQSSKKPKTCSAGVEASARPSDALSASASSSRPASAAGRSRGSRLAGGAASLLRAASAASLSRRKGAEGAKPPGRGKRDASVVGVASPEPNRPTKGQKDGAGENFATAESGADAIRTAESHAKAQRAARGGERPHARWMPTPTGRGGEGTKGTQLGMSGSPAASATADQACSVPPSSCVPRSPPSTVAASFACENQRFAPQGVERDACWSRGGINTRDEEDEDTIETAFRELTLELCDDRLACAPSSAARTSRAKTAESFCTPIIKTANTWSLVSCPYTPSIQSSRSPARSGHTPRASAAPHASPLPSSQELRRASSGSPLPPSSSSAPSPRLLCAPAPPPVCHYTACFSAFAEASEQEKFGLLADIMEELWHAAYADPRLDGEDESTPADRGSRALHFDDHSATAQPVAGRASSDGVGSLRGSDAVKNASYEASDSGGPQTPWLLTGQSKDEKRREEKCPFFLRTGNWIELSRFLSPHMRRNLERARKAIDSRRPKRRGGAHSLSGGGVHSGEPTNMSHTEGGEAGDSESNDDAVECTGSRAG